MTHQKNKNYIFIFSIKILEGLLSEKSKTNSNEDSTSNSEKKSLSLIEFQNLKEKSFESFIKENNAKLQVAKLKTEYFEKVIY